MTAETPRRFCMVTTFYPPYAFGGDGIFVYHLADALARRGHQVEVVHCVDAYRTFVGGGGDPDPWPHHPGVTVHGLRSGVGVVSPLATQQTGRPLLKAGKIRRILDRGFDVIHFHNVSLVGGPGVLALGRARKLYTMHEYWIECPRHDLYRFGRTPCDAPRCFTCMLAHRRPPQLWRYTSLMGRSLDHVDLFLAPSRFMLERFRRAEPGRPARYLPNFVPAARRDGGPGAGVSGGRSRGLAAGGRPYFLYAGRLEASKGVRSLIPLFRDHPRATLVVAGTGSQEAELHRLAGGSDSIRFLGHLSQAELVPWYEGAVAVMLPSLWYEVFPLVILEAFRAGTPVICRNLGSPPGILAESGGGLAFDDEAHLARLVDRLLDEPDTRDRLGVTGQAHFVRHWTTEAHLDRYFEALADLDAGGGATPGGGSGGG